MHKFIIIVFIFIFLFTIIYLFFKKIYKILVNTILNTS